jgi:hypothetical protein
MYITSFQVLNFKSYLDSNQIELKRGFNIITGQNSAGKTALLEAMALQAKGSPHLSLQSIPTRGMAPPQDSLFRFTLSLTRDELFQFLGNSQHLVPPPIQGFNIPGNGPYKPQANEGQFLRWLFQQPEYSIPIQLLRRPNGSEEWTSLDPPPGNYPTAAHNADASWDMLAVTLQTNGEPRFDGFIRSGGSGYFSTDIASLAWTRIYRFLAERFSMGQSRFGNNAVLAQNAQNLPEAINTLTSNPVRFSQLNDLVREVLPQVRQVSVRTLPEGQLQIIVWPHDPATARDDLAIPLNDCGSGVGQTLAILYVVMTSYHSQVIIVDEPQNFLHPGAVRKLIEVLKRYPQHQYIFATHSPTVITAAEPATLTMVRAEGAETSLQVLDPLSSNDLSSYLSEIGARLSDVFGADNILWVEGQTEETCFPRILKIVAGKSLAGTSIVGIRQTGDLTGRDKKKVLEMYSRLAAANSLLPPAVAFVLDRECLTDQQLDDIMRAGRLGEGTSLVRFLPRRMYENYILHSQAIAEVANSINGFRPSPVAAAEVQQRLDAKSRDRQSYCPGLQGIPDDWLSRVDGARLLSDIFSELSENRASYEKTTHSVAITEWILEHDPEKFQDLAGWLTLILKVRD